MKIVNCKLKIAGFTLVELMVVIALITVFASVFLLGRNKYSERLNLKTQAYTLASLVRQAQSYSLGVRADSGNFGISYGVSIGRSAPTYITLFADRNKNGLYDSASGEAVDSYNMSDGTIISNLCGLTGGGENCSNIDRIEVTFNRPNPTAEVKLLNNAGNPVPSRNPPGKIYMQSPSGEGIVVSIDSTGQVSIQ